MPGQPGLIAVAAALLLASCCTVPRRAPSSGAIPVCAADSFTAVGAVRAGVRYRIVAAGLWQDAGNVADAHGYPSKNALMRRFEPRRRVPGANWFALVGVVAPGGAATSVLRRDFGARLADLSPHAGGRPWIAPADGVLYVAANDVPFMYFNNSGFLWVEVIPHPLPGTPDGG